MSNLGARARAEEQMDSADLEEATYVQVLRDLTKVNRWTLAARPTLDFLRSCASGRQSLSILDVGYGSCDMLRRIAEWAQRSRLDVALSGIDLNSKSLAAARAQTAGLNVELLVGDYRALVERSD